MRDLWKMMTLTRQHLLGLFSEFGGIKRDLCKETISKTWSQQSPCSGCSVIFGLVDTKQGFLKSLLHWKSHFDDNDLVSCKDLVFLDSHLYSLPSLVVVT